MCRVSGAFAARSQTREPPPALISRRGWATSGLEATDTAPCGSFRVATGRPVLASHTCTGLPETAATRRPSALRLRARATGLPGPFVKDASRAPVAVSQTTT
jgi:hypothetical protein